MIATTTLSTRWQFDDVPDEEQPQAEAAVSASSDPVVKKLSDLVLPAKGDPGELLERRFLCRGGALLLAGPTGVGKSTFGEQCEMLWALGRPAFGITPARPLSSLLIQAENDEGDLAELRDGIIAGLRLSPDEARLVGERILVCREDGSVGRLFLDGVVRPLLKTYQPDLVFIDPALAFLGGDTNSQKDVGGFLRNGLQPLLREFECGAVITHHTSKPPAAKDRKGGWRGSDLAYSGSGSAEWANWPRAVLALEGTSTPGEFRLHAAKRGGRLGWRERDGETPAFVKLVRHSRKRGVICWEEVAAEEFPAVPSVDPIRDLLLTLVPVEKPISKALLIASAPAKGVSEGKARALIDQLVQEGVLQLKLEPRSGTNPLKLISRSPVS